MIRSVSVECDNIPCKTLVTWSVPDNLPANATGYEIYEYWGLPNCFWSIIKISDPSATTYLASNIAAKGYAMAITTTGENEPITQRHKQPVITSVDFNPCNYQATIRWTPYVGWDKENTEYAVYARVGAASTYTLLAGHIADTSFVWMDAPTREALSILVQAENKTDASAAGKAQPWDDAFNFPRVPDHIRLSALEYTEGKAALTFDIDQHTELTKFEVQRASAETSFAPVASFSDKATTTHTDESGAGVYHYRIVAKNDCDSIAAVSDTLANILMKMSQNGNQWLLQWNNDTLSPMVYVLNRRQPQPGALFSGSPLTAYTDNIPSMINEPSLAFCYEVEGATPAGNTSRSQICADYTPTVVMPDAIDPLNIAVNAQTGRARNQFGPVINVHPQTYNYRLTILNRNGAVVADIHKTTADNPLDKSWDGRLRNGDPAPAEVFTYYLSVEFEGGYQRTMTGAVTVMYSK